MGIGYWTSEQILFNDQGQLLTNGTWEYKPPSTKEIPIEWNVSLLKDCPNPLGVLGSKASGEPPMTLSTSVFFAILHAVNAARSDAGLTALTVIDAPLTVDQIQQACGVAISQFTLN